MGKQKKYDYRVLYDSKTHKKDDNNFLESLKNGNVDLQTFRRLMVSDLCQNTQILNTGYIGHIRLEDAAWAMKHPRANWRLLLELSKLLMHTSPYYYRLNMYYSNMAMFCWWIDLYDVSDNINIDTVRKTYAKLSTRFENMNLKHEFGKIMKVIPYQDIYCGLVVENTNNTDFFFQEIDYRVCRLFQVQDGLYNFDINLSAIKAKNLSAYPDYVQKAYLDFIDGKIDKWYLPPADKQICIKLNCQWTYPYPMLIGLIQDIIDLDIYKKLKLQSARTDNYKAIMIKVPIDESTVDKPLLSPELLSIFADINRDSLSDDVGLIYTLGATGEAVSFKESNNTTNNVSDAVNEIYNSSGESRELFNGSSSGTAVKLSVENDAGFIYGLYRQFERWCNRYIKLKKYNKTNFKFYFYLLDITIFNKDDVTKRYKEAITLGATVVDKWLASLGMTPSRTMGSFVLHKDIFDFQNNFITLSSAFNSSNSNSEAGRPTNESQGIDLSDEGEKTADGEKNDG